MCGGHNLGACCPFCRNLQILRPIVTVYKVSMLLHSTRFLHEHLLHFAQVCLGAFVLAHFASSHMCTSFVKTQHTKSCSKSVPVTLTHPAQPGCQERKFTIVYSCTISKLRQHMPHSVIYACDHEQLALSKLTSLTFKDLSVTTVQLVWTSLTSVSKVARIRAAALHHLMCNAGIKMICTALPASHKVWLLIN